MYKLLIVDDNVRERSGVAKLGMWKELGFDEIYTAQNGQEGYEKALEIKPTLVISDVSMPVMDGLSMAKKILADVPKAKFIFISCFDDSNYIRDAIDLNAFAYILKPLNLEKLKASVVKILNISESEQKTENTIDILRSDLKKNLPIIKEQITRDWLHGRLTDVGARQLIPLGLEIKSFCAAANLQISLNDDETETGSKYLVINMIEEIIKKTVEGSFRYSLFVQSQRELGMLLYLDTATDGDEAASIAVDCFEHIKTAVNERLKADVSVYIGGVSGSYTEMPELFERAERFRRNGICGKRNSVVLVEEQEVGKVLDYDAEKLKGEIFSLLENGGKEDTEAFVEKYLTSETMQPELAVKKFVYTAITTLQLVLFEMGESFKIIFNDEFFVWEKLERYNTIHEIKNLLINVLNFSADYLQNRKNDRYTQLVKDIKKIIEEQYATLKNVDQIVAQIFFSAAHANMIFKKYTGCTIFDYLTQYKIDQAKKMLSRGNCKIYEVSDFLGYKNKNYFTVLFKEYTGLTPRQYRDKMIHEENR